MDAADDDDDKDSDDDDCLDNNDQQVNVGDDNDKEDSDDKNDIDNVDDQEVNVGNDNKDDNEEGVKENKNLITLQDMRDGVVGTVTKKSHLNEILTFIKQGTVHQPTWLTSSCKDKLMEIEERICGF
jgi:hypothetical protein